MARKKAAARQRGLVIGYVEHVASTAFERFAGVITELAGGKNGIYACLLYTSPSPRDRTRSRMPSSA